jgi:hypothetical protein
MSKTVFKLTDGTEADFDSKTPLSKVDEILAKNGLERDKSQRPFIEREGVSGAVDESLAKVNYPIVQGVAGLGGLAGALQKGVEFGTGKIAELLGYTPEQAQAGRMAVNLPTPSDITRAAGDAGIPMRRAESFIGRTGQNVVRNIISAPVAGAAIPSLLSAVGEEAVAYPFRGTPMESTARTAGALFTPLVQAPSLVASPLERMYREMTKNVSPQDLAQAQALQQRSFAERMPVTSIEAIQQTTGGRTSLPTIQRQVEGTPASAPTMAEFMGTRGQQTLRELESRFPVTGRERLGTEAERAAKETLGLTQRQLSSSPAGQAFEAVKSKSIPPSWIKNLENESAVISEASRAVDNTATYQDMMKGYKGNSIARIEAMRSYLSDKYDNLADAVGGTKVTGEMRAYDQARRKLLEKADSQIPDYKKARENYFQAKEQIVAPVQESPVAQIARGNEVSAQFAEVFATNPAAVNLTPKKVQMTMRSLGQTDANLPKDFLTQYMRASLESVNKAATRQVGTTGSRFADTIAKNTTQRENLKAAFQEVYGQKGTEAVRGLNNLLDILEAQGRRLPTGSATAEKGMMSQESISTLGKIGKDPLGSFGTIYQSVFYGRDYDKIARAITSPRGVELLEEMAKAGKNQKRLATGAQELQRLIDGLDEGAE